MAERVDPRRIYDYLLTKGVAPGSAAGILANIEFESSFRPDAVGDGGTSGGLFQHHASRWSKLKAYAQSTGRAWNDWTAQVDFALQEARAMKINLGSSDAQAASREWTLRFERPADMYRKATLRAAQAGKYEYGGSASTGEFDVAPGRSIDQQNVQMVNRDGQMVPSGLWQLPEFMRALRQHETKSDYSLISRHNRGAYGITEDNWNRWTRQLGVWGARWQNHTAQDYVARQKLTEYYLRYQDWRLVAVAWWEGTAAADAIATTNELARSPWSTEVIGLMTELGMNPGSPFEGRSATNMGQGFIPDMSTPSAMAYGGSPIGDTQLTTARRNAGVMPDPSRESFMMNSEMHKKMAPMLQGLSNAIKAGAPIADAPLITEEEEGPR